MGLKDKGYPSIEELKKARCYPSEKRIAEGPVAVIECIQEIPCDPCETACKLGAIKIGSPITNIPEIAEEKCTGCGLCISNCPGLAIFVIDKNYTEETGTVSFPYEFLPLPEVNSEVKAVDRKGDIVCKGEVVRVVDKESFDRTPVITIEIPRDKIDEVRGIKRI